MSLDQINESDEVYNTEKPAKKSWSMVVSSAVPSKPKLADIMEEQEKNALDSTKSNDLSVYNVNAQEDEDFLLALKLQSDPLTYSETSGQELEDYMLCQAIAAIEQDEAAQSIHNDRASSSNDTLAYSKIKVRSVYDGGEMTQKMAYANVTSSAWRAAVQLEKNTQLHEPEKLSDMQRHDPLLNSLKVSEQLTEYDGVGDLSGLGLMVNKSTAIPVKNFIDKQNKPRRIIGNKKDTMGSPSVSK